MKKEEECVTEMLTSGQIEPLVVTGSPSDEKGWRYQV